VGDGEEASAVVSLAEDVYGPFSGQARANPEPLSTAHVLQARRVRLRNLPCNRLCTPCKQCPIYHWTGSRQRTCFCPKGCSKGSHHIFA